MPKEWKNSPFQHSSQIPIQSAVASFEKKPVVATGRRRETALNRLTVDFTKCPWNLRATEPPYCARSRSQIREELDLVR